MGSTQTSEPEVTKLGPGSYRVESRDHTVSVDRFDHLRGPGKWIARAQWTSSTVSDPLPTMRDAIRSARAMILHAEDDED